MTKPQRYINRVILFLILVAAVAAVVHAVLWRAFTHNPALNGLIVGVAVLGIAYGLRRIYMIKREVRWIEAFRTSGPGFSLQDPPRLLAPMAAALGERERHGKAVLSSMSMQALLDSLSSRLEETRDISRYQTGLLIFLGLLGTFWGLIETINSVGLVINDLSLTGDDMAGVFDELKAGLAAPMAGMGTAFSSSLFGLAGSLVLGFIDLQAGQAQNAFYNDTEEWLSTLTRVSGPEAAVANDGVSGAALAPYLGAMLQQTAENLEHLRQTVHRGEDDRVKLNEVLIGLNNRLEQLSDRLQRENQLLLRLAEGAARDTNAGLEEALREQLRVTDARLSRLIDETVRGREESLRELKGEIRQVSRTIAIASGAVDPHDPPPRPGRG